MAKAPLAQFAKNSHWYYLFFVNPFADHIMSFMSAPLEVITDLFETGQQLRQRFFEANAEQIRRAALQTAIAFARHGKLLLCGTGNGGFCARNLAHCLLNPASYGNPSLAAIALKNEGYCHNGGYREWDEDIYDRQIAALGRESDILLVIADENNCLPLIGALRRAASQNIYSILFSLNGNESMEELADLLINMKDVDKSFVAEVQSAFAHAYRELIDYYLFENPGDLIRESKNPGE